MPELVQEHVVKDESAQRVARPCDLEDAALVAGEDGAGSSQTIRVVGREADPPRRSRDVEQQDPPDRDEPTEVELAGRAPDERDLPQTVEERRSEPGKDALDVALPHGVDVTNARGMNDEARQPVALGAAFALDDGEEALGAELAPSGALEPRVVSAARREGVAHAARRADPERARMDTPRQATGLAA